MAQSTRDNGLKDKKMEEGNFRINLQVFTMKVNGLTVREMATVIWKWKIEVFTKVLFQTIT